MDFFIKIIESQDNITDLSYQLLHFDSEKKTRSFLGGTCTLICKLFILIFTIENFEKMVNFSDPSIVTVENGMTTNDNETISILDMSKVMIGLYEIDEQSDNFIKPIKFGQETEKYIDIQIKNVINKYHEDGTLN